MDRKKLTILTYAMTNEGSLNPFIGIAQNLQRFGHRIIFAIEDEHKEKVINYGFETIMIQSNVTDQNDIDNEIREFFNNFLYKLMDTSFTILDRSIMRTQFYIFIDLKIKMKMNDNCGIKEIIDKIDPNIILVNRYACTMPSIIKCGRPWISVAAAGPSLFIDDIRTPPPESGLPENDRTEWNYFRNERLKVYNKYRQSHLQWLSNYGISLPIDSIIYHSEYNNIYNYPKELDYTDLRPLPSKWTQFDAFVRMEYKDFNIPEKLRGKTGKLIYLTMGTFLSSYIEIMKQLIGFLSESPHRFIVSKGMFGDRYELPDNMWGEPMLPQTKVLPLVDMIIFHGGNNTLVESFYFGKPMIVMPFCGDQYDNAQRVHEKGFGIRMDSNKYTKEELINSIEKILNDEELIMKMKEISKRIQTEAKSDKLTKFIESYATM